MKNWLHVTLSAVALAALISTTPASAAPTLNVGDSAPELHVDKWVKGPGISKLESGKIYVVEFWATWCGPCMRSIPHLTSLQAKYKDKVTIIGVASYEYGGSSEDKLKRLEDFLSKGSPKYGYRMAFDDSGKMNEDWMDAARRRGIPSAFIVNGDGKVAWMGHPMSMDSVLEKVVEGTWDMSHFEE